MVEGIFTVRFWKDAADRAVKSAAQAVAGLFLGDQVFDVWHFNWKLAGGAALGAAVLSLVSSLISSRLGGDRTSASAVDLSR